MLGQLIINPSNTSRYCLYSVHDATTGVCLFIEVATLTEAVNLTQVLGLPDFDRTKPHLIKIHSEHDKKHDASNGIRALQIQLNNGRLPPLNYGWKSHGWNPVVCEQTGKRYQHARQACEELGVDAARMSRHLARRPGFKTIKGFTFRHGTHISGLQGGTVVNLKPSPESGMVGVRDIVTGETYHVLGGVVVACYDKEGRQMPPPDNMRMLSTELIRSGVQMGRLAIL